MGFSVQLITYFIMSFNTPLLCNHLTEIGYSPVFIGWTFVFASMCYIISMLAVASLTKHISRKGVLVIGLTCQTLGCLISGTDQILDWYNPGFFSIIGTMVIGFGTGMSVIPVMPEIIEGIESHPRFVFSYDEITLQNNLAGYFICCQSLGETIGPLASSFLEQGIEFRNSQIVLCTCATLFVMVYLLSFGVIGFFKYRPHVKSNLKNASN